MLVTLNDILPAAQKEHYAVGLFNTVINVVLLVSMNTIVKKMNDGKGV